MRCLVVEDEFTSRMQMKYFLEEYGHCDVVVNGVEALEAFKMAVEQRKPYSLICLDIKLPEMDGHQVLEEIRKIEWDMGRSLRPAVIFMTTARADAESVYGSRGLCNEYLLKPIDREMLVDRLRKYSLLRTG